MLGPAPLPEAAGTASPVPRSTDPPAALDAYYTQTLSWEPGPDGARHECTTMEVPVDYDDPGGDTFSLALRKVPATDPDHRRGTLVINPGGPGGSGVDYARYSAVAFSPAVRAVYDVIGFDPRGIGASDAVACLGDVDIDALFDADPTPDTVAERRQLESVVKETGEACWADGGERVRHLSTTDVARDMDVLRAAVGEEKLDYLGVSYGTLLGALYADLFPARVGRFVLDSAISPTQTELEEAAADIQGFESSVRAFLDWCVARDECALGTDRAAAEDRLVRLLDDVDANPLRTDHEGLARMGEGWVSFAVVMGLYSDALWPTLNIGLAEAVGSGRGEVLASLAATTLDRQEDGSYSDNSYLHALIPVRCSDWPRGATDAATALEYEKLAAQHPLWARLSGDPVDLCTGWSGDARTPSGGALAEGAAPILVIGNERDPATPIAGTRQLAQDLASGVLVRVDADGHGSYRTGNRCADDAVDDYLVQGVAPQDGTRCAAD